MQEIATIQFLNVEADEEYTVIVAVGKEHVHLYTCITNRGDEEVFLSIEHCKCLVDALKHALEELEQDSGDSLEIPASRGVSNGQRRIMAKEVATIRFPNIETGGEATIVISIVGRKVGLRANPGEYEAIQVLLDVERCCDLIEALEQAILVLGSLCETGGAG